MSQNSFTPGQEAERQGSPERFGYSWARFSSPSEDQRIQFERWTCLLQPKDWQGAAFLDGGCGAGRNSLWAIRAGAAQGTAIDLDERSLAAARINLQGLPVEVRRQSLYEITEENRYDIVFSIGVIHHLEHPGLAIEMMVRAARPGGKILVWLYGRENMGLLVLALDPLRKFLFSKLPLPAVWFLATCLTLPLYAILKLGFAPIEYFKLIRSFSYDHLRHIVFDQMIPRIAKYYRQEEAKLLLEQAGLSNVRCQWVNEMSWTVMGVKPDQAEDGA